MHFFFPLTDRVIEKRFFRMRDRYVVRLALLSTTAILGVAGGANGASFQGLGDLPGGAFESRALSVSGDGSVVVGWSESASGQEAFRWENGVMTGLGDLPGGDFLSEARGVSGDGSIIVGKSRSSSGNEAFRWENGVMTGLGTLPGGSFFSSEANAISADGSVIVGRTTSSATNEAFRWENGVMTGLGNLDGFFSQANAVAADGSVIVGVVIASGINEAFRWENDVMTPLGTLGGNTSQGYAVSADGSVIAGVSHDGALARAFRWENGTMVSLGDLPRAFNTSGRPSAISPDGTVITGFLDQPGLNDAFVWNKSQGMRKLIDQLSAHPDLDLTGWKLVDATGISDNKRVYVGRGVNPSGQSEAWMASLAGPVHWSTASSGDWDNGANWGPLNLFLPVAIEPVFIEPDAGVVVDGPSLDTAVASLVIGAKTSGFAELRLEPGITLTTTNGVTIANRGRVSGSGTLASGLTIQAGGELVALTGDNLTVDADNTISDGKINALDGTLTFTGPAASGATAQINGVDSVFNFDGGLTNDGVMKLIDATVNGDVVNNGSIATTGTGTFTGTVSGSGDFTGSGTVIFDGTFSPGDSPGQVAIDGHAVLGPTAVLVMELAGRTHGVDYDQVVVAGNLTLGGTLDMQLLDGFTPHLGDTFDLLDSDAITGSFDSINLPTLAHGLSFDASSLLTTGSILVVPEPTMLSVLLVGGLALGRRRW